MNKSIKQTILLITIGLTTFTLTSIAPDLLQKIIISTLIVWLWIMTTLYLIYGIIINPAIILYYAFKYNDYETVKQIVPELTSFKSIAKSIGKYIAKLIVMIILYTAAMYIHSKTITETEQPTSQVLVSL